MSKSLVRLRNTFEDPILDRVQGGYQLTILASRLVQPLKEVLADIEQIINSLYFDPKTTERTFSICSLDYAELMIGVKLMKWVELEAPNSKIEFVSRTAESLDHLYKGIVDVIISLKPKQLLENIQVEQVLKDRIVCVVDKNHPVANELMTLDKFLEYPHCVLQTGNDELFVDDVLGAMNKSRRVVKQSPNFVASITSLKDTNMIMSVPESTVRAAGRLVDISVHQMPFNTPELNLCLIWHKRNNERPGHVWFREHLKDLIRGCQVLT